MKKTMLTMVLATAITANSLTSGAAGAIIKEKAAVINQVEVNNSIESVNEIPQADVFNVDFSRGTGDDYSILNNIYKTVGTPTIKDSEEKDCKVASFDGKSAYVYGFDESKYDRMRTEEGVTIEATFKYNEIPSSGERDIFSNQQSGGIGIGLEKGKLQFYCNVNGSYKQPSATIEAGVWYHAVGTYDGEVARLYLNGELVSSITAKGSLTFTSSANAKNFVIGGDSNSSGGAEYLSDSEVLSAKLYGKALSAEEVKAVYEAEDMPVILFDGEAGDMELNTEVVLPVAIASNNSQVKLTVTDPNGEVVEVVDNKITPDVLGPYTFKYEAEISEGQTLVSTIKRNVVAYDKAVLNFGIVSSDSVNPDAVINTNLHLNKSDSTYVDKVEFDVTYDANALTYEKVSKSVSNVTVTKVNDGKLHVVVNGGISTSGFVNYAETLKARLNFRANENYTGVDTTIKYENIIASYNGKEIESENAIQNKTIKIRTEKALDLNGDGVIGAGDISLASTEDEAKAIADKASIYPYKHVVVVTTDGGGASFRPDKMYYAKNNLTIPTLTDDSSIMAKRNNPYAMNLFNEIAATSYSAQTEMPAISAQNYSSIIHGAEYKELPSEYKIDNTYTSSYYFPDYGKETEQYPSVFKAVKEQLPTSNTAAFAEWYQIVNGIIEPDSGANVFQVTNESGKSMGFSEISNYIKSDDFKDTSLLYLQSDYMDSIGHSYGYYTDKYYTELQKYDEYYETLINSLVESGTMDETLLIFNSDHGGTFTGHGSLNGPSDRDIQIAIVGDTIDNGKKLSGGTNHDISPLALSALRLEETSSMDGSASFAEEAFLSQEELVKKERDVETVVATADSSINTIQLYLDNVKAENIVNTIDVVMNIGDNNISEIVTEGTVLREKIEDGKLYLTIKYDNEVKELVNVIFEDSIEDCKVDEYMIATTTGNEIYGDLVNTDGEISNAAKYNVYMDDISNIEGKAGIEIKVPMYVEELPVDESVRTAEMVFDIPSDLTVKDIQLNEKVMNADNWDYNITDGKLRIALTNLNGESIEVSQDKNDKKVLTLRLQLNADKTSDDAIAVTMEEMILRCDNDIDIVYNVEKAVSNITFAEKEVAQAFPRELYSVEDNTVMPKGYKAYAIEFTGVGTMANISSNSGLDLYYSADFTEKNGKLTYVTLVPNNVDIVELADMNSYTISKGQATSILNFGDMNNDGIDAQDALAAVAAWLRSNELDNKSMVAINVSGDGAINTRDAIEIVDNYVSGKEFKILSK